MLKKISISLFKFLSFISLLVIAFSAEIYSSLFASQNSANLFRYILYFIVLALMFPIFKNFYPASWKWKKSIIVHFSISILIFALFEFITFKSDAHLGIKQFNYPIANCFETFRGVMSNPIADTAIEKTISVLPFSYIYVLSNLADGCRVLHLKTVLENPKNLKNICPGDTKPTCFNKVATDNLAVKPFNGTGIILMVALGAMNIFEEKNDRKLNKNPLLTTEIKDRNHLLNLLNSGFDLMEMIFLLQESYMKNGRIEKIIKNFPSKDIDQMPLPIKKVFKNISIENADFYKMIFHLPNKYQVYFENIDSKTQDAFLAKTVDDEIFIKFQKTSCSRMLEMQISLKKKLSSEEYLKKLTYSEIDSFKKRLAQIKFDQTCIGADQRAEN